ISCLISSIFALSSFLLFTFALALLLETLGAPCEYFVLFVVKTPVLKKFYRKFTPQQLYDFTTQQLYNSTALRLPNHLQDLAVLKPTSHEIFYCFGFALVFLAGLLFKI